MAGGYYDRNNQNNRRDDYNGYNNRYNDRGDGRYNRGDDRNDGSKSYGNDGYYDKNYNRRDNRYDDGYGDNRRGDRPNDRYNNDNRRAVCRNWLDGFCDRPNCTFWHPETHPFYAYTSRQNDIHPDELRLGVTLNPQMEAEADSVQIDNYIAYNRETKEMPSYKSFSMPFDQRRVYGEIEKYQNDVRRGGSSQRGPQRDVRNNFTFRQGGGSNYRYEGRNRARQNYSGNSYNSNYNRNDYNSGNNYNNYTGNNYNNNYNNDNSEFKTFNNQSSNTNAGDSPDYKDFNVPFK